MALFPPTFLPLDPPAVNARNVAHWHDEGAGLLADVARRLRLAEAFANRTLTPEQARRLLQGVIDAVKPVVSGLTDSLIKGATKLATWFRAFKSTLIPGIFAGGLAILGHADVPPVDRDAIMFAANGQVEFLARFRDQIANATVILDGNARARAEMYAHSLWGISQKVLVAKQERDGFTQGISKLGIADHCGQCLSEARRGWVAIGSIVVPGDRTCKSGCRCWIETR